MKSWLPNNYSYSLYEPRPDYKQSSSSRSRFILPFRFGCRIWEHQPGIVSGGSIFNNPTNKSPIITSTSSSGSSSKQHKNLYNLFNLTRRLNFSGSSSGSGLGVGSGKFIGSTKSSSSFSPTKSTLKNLFSSSKRKVTFSPVVSRSASPLSFGLDAIVNDTNPIPRSPSPHRSYLMEPTTTNPMATMDWKQNITTDHTDIVYREAVSRLRSILSPRPHSAQGTTTPTPASAYSKKENIGPISSSKSFDSSPPTKRDRLASSSFRSLFTSRFNNNDLQQQQQQRLPMPSNTDQTDLFDFIDKQAQYINQLEKESSSSKAELGSMLAHVRQIISENELLHEKSKQDLLSSMIQQLNDKTTASDAAAGDTFGGYKQPGAAQSNKTQTLLRDSRVAELEAQLNQTKRALRSAQEEILDMRRNGGGKAGAGAGGGDGSAKPTDMNCEQHAAKIESLVREKEDLLATMNKFKEQISELRDRESEATKKVKASLEIVEQMQMEKTQSELETRRVKDELDRHQARVRELISDHSRKLHEEKLSVESKYRAELELLNSEMNQDLDTLTKARLDLERQKRVEAELRRELQQRILAMDELRQEMQLQTHQLQSELSQVQGQKNKCESDLINSRLQLEKLERDSRHEVGRCQAEIGGLRKRLEESDGEVGKCQDIISKLNSNISRMQHENSMAKLRLEEHGVFLPPTSTAVSSGDGTSLKTNTAATDVVSMIQVIEDKHSREMTELEQLVHVQNDLLDKLRSECSLLTDKLEQTSTQYKREKQSICSEKEKLVHLNKLNLDKTKDLESKLASYQTTHGQLTQRIHRLEDDDKSRSDRIFQLLSKQGGLLKENQHLQNEIALLKTKLGQHENDDDDDDEGDETTSRRRRKSQNINRRSNRGIH